MSLWDTVSDELALWGDGLPPARLWLRDDDAEAPTSNLEKLGRLTGQFNVPITIAVVPQPASVALAEWIFKHKQFSIALHGYSHHNYAPVSEKKCELGLHRGAQVVLDELAIGRGKLGNMFGDRFIDMLVPPWNRIDQHLLSFLAELGFKSLSTFTWKDFTTIPGLVQLNCHVDIIDWRGSRGGRAIDDLIGELAEALQTARESGGAPIGILTHHLVHDAAAWDFLEQLFQFTSNRGDIVWCHAASLTGGSDL